MLGKASNTAIPLGGHQEHDRNTGITPWKGAR
jgi:hypothetical protein